MREFKRNSATINQLPYPEAVYKVLKKHKYHVIGGHSAVKKCEWTHNSLVEGRVCYKERFYGIRSHRCLQMSPAVMNCLTYCIYCWRAMPEDLGLHWPDLLHHEWDEPEIIFEGSLKEHKRILSGYKDQVIKGYVDAKKFEEALHPNMVAISLSGEPTLYPHLERLINLYKKYGFTVFLVTSGVVPEALKRLEEEPSQLYLSLTSPDPETYSRVNRPISQNLWISVMKSIDLMKSFTCPTAMRITAIKGVNMGEDMAERFARLALKGDFSHIEVKGYMNVGYSMKRLSRENMPEHEEVRNFANRIASECEYRYLDESPDSRVVLLSKWRRATRFDQD